MPAADFHRARFLTSAARLSQAPADEGFEIAFAGRSNAGKSSCINRLCQQKGLARTSKTPGRTQLLNFFSLDDRRRLVDLPGYGYAKVAIPIKRQWQGALADYLEQRHCLRGLILLMDVRHPLKDYDRQMLAWAASIDLRVHCVLTKCDKLRRGLSEPTLAEVRLYVEAERPDYSAQLFSATKGYGLADLYAIADEWLELAAVEQAQK
ncbi:MAG: ribosome biogenesis GTP-binding protein YihA/YsxC [Erythrobacter sp.]|nr:ribosome biogenesis GTP-binding protein YihA/YsxC [Erythrobacter sp.]